MVRPEVKKKQRQLVEAAVKSRKERKRLDKILIRKSYKTNRKSLLDELEKVQLKPDELHIVSSTSSMQTKGLKRFKCDEAKKSFTHVEQCPGAASLIRRKKRKILPKRSQSETESSSEDTDAVSTDTEQYYQDEKLELKHDEQACQVEDFLVKKTFKEKALVQAEQTEVKPKFIKDEPIHCEPAVYVTVTRDPEVTKSRSELPIIGEEQQIMEDIRYNDIVIISGETGSGKTTQLPQFLYEAGYTIKGRLIGITEPRRVAAITMSERVGLELNLKDEVAYQIRFSGNVSEKTQIKFMTDGVLLKECQHDFLLSKYSALIIDEAHERSIFSDILIGLLSRIVPLRRKKDDPLKLIIMSATLRVSDFTENTHLFPVIPPIIKIEARQFPVTVQFAKTTPDNYLEAAYKKVCAIHAKMPRGGILVFVTSQMDVKALCRKLKKKSMLYCLGLYAMLPLEKQKFVFRKPPEDSRLCVIATNVAETSITIPNIKYVVDTGLEKRKYYDLLTGVSRFVTTWTSRSSAEQRTGRAGRMGPGYCYRLYSSAVYTNDFSEFSEPQILLKPIEDVLLQMKTMNIDNVVNFPFPTRPSIDALKTAEKKLVLLGALDDSNNQNNLLSNMTLTEYASRPTLLGKAMAKFAVSARCSKMIVTAPPDILPYVVCLVSALTVREMFLNGQQYSELHKKWAGKGECKRLGDYMVMIRAVIESQKLGCSTKLCQEKGLRPKAMLEIDKLRAQLTSDVNNNLMSVTLKNNSRLKRPSEEQCRKLRQLLYNSFCDHVATKIPDGETAEKTQSDSAIKKRLKNAYECKESNEPVYISSESVLKSRHPDFVLYKELYKGDKKTYMRDVAVIDPAWLPEN